MPKWRVLTNGNGGVLWDVRDKNKRKEDVGDGFLPSAIFRKLNFSLLFMGTETVQFHV